MKKLTIFLTENPCRTFQILWKLNSFTFSLLEAFKLNLSVSILIYKTVCDIIYDFKKWEIHTLMQLLSPEMEN